MLHALPRPLTLSALSARVPAHGCAGQLAPRTWAMLDVVRRRGRTWGLLAQYEEGRLGLAGPQRARPWPVARA